jgi:Flp pilus assembly protein TadD
MDKFETAKQCFLEGLRLLETNNFEAAGAQFARSLQLVPDRVSTLTNLSAVKLKQKQFTEAEQFARKAVALEENTLEAWANLGTALLALEQYEEALSACDRALGRNPAHAKSWLTKTTVLLRLKRFDEALLACEQALKLDAGDPEILYTQSLILKELGRPDEAQEIYRKSLKLRAASSPMVSSERRATQKAEVLVINGSPDIGSTLKSFEALHLDNFPGQLAGHFPEDFHFTYIFAGEVARPSVRQQLPQPAFVINNNVNAEGVLSAGGLSGLIGLVESFGVPVVNHPTKIVGTTRDAAAKLFADIPGLTVPQTMRFFSLGKSREELVREIEAQYDYPLITRTLVSQQGKGMTKVDSREALVAVLASDFREKDFFVTDFVDSRGRREFYRKIRAAIVRGEIIIVRADYDVHWNVHGRKSDERVAFYLKNSHLLAEENQLCQDPAAEFGKSVLQALQTICQRIPLDIFGVDFDVDPNGQLVFYEANATMNLFSTARKEVPHPPAPEDRLKQAFQRYFASLVAQRQP